MTASYVDEVANLTKHNSGLYFNISSVNIQQLEGFSIKDLTHVVRRSAPRLWEMLAVVMSANLSESMASTSSMGEDDDSDDMDNYRVP